MEHQIANCKPEVQIITGFKQQDLSTSFLKGLEKYQTLQSYVQVQDNFHDNEWYVADGSGRQVPA